MKNIKRKLKFGIIFICLLSLWTSCEKTEYSGIPIVNTNFTVNIYGLDQGNLANIPGNYAFFREGYRGILLYCIMPEQYVAYERTCTFEPQGICKEKLEIDDSGSFLHCSGCGSEFMIYSGGIPTKGSKAKKRLYSFNTIYNGINGTVHVYN